MLELSWVCGMMLRAQSRAGVCFWAVGGRARGSVARELRKEQDLVWSCVRKGFPDSRENS